MRPFCCLIAAGLTSLTAGAVDPEPLSVVSADTWQVHQVLRELSAGQTASFTDLPDRLLLHPPGRLVPPTRWQRWTIDLPQALAQAPDRDALLAALDHRFDRLVNEAPPTLAPVAHRAWCAALAADFLPGPRAAACLRAAADQAFDHGDHATYLAIVGILRAVDGDDDAVRVAIAVERLGRDPQRGGVPRPGPLVPAPAPPAPATTVFKVLAGLLVRLDPWNRVVWQIALPRQAQTWLGDEAALVADETGFHLYDLAGTRRDLGAVGALSCLGLRGAYAWFAAGEQVHRVRLHDLDRTVLVLPAAPVAPPLARGRESLWLTATTVVACRDGTVTGGFRHDLDPAGDGWSWCETGGAVLLTGPAGTWRLTTPDPDRLEHLVRAGDYAAAIARFGVLTAPTAEDRHWFARAGLATDPTTLAWEDLARPDLAAADLLRLAHRWSATTPAAARRFLELAAELPDELLPCGIDDLPLDPPGRWHHRASAATVAARQTAGAEDPVPATVIAALLAGGLPTIRDDQAGDAPIETPLAYCRHPRLGMVQGDDRVCYQIRGDDGMTEVTAYDSAGETLRWRHRWPVPSTLPSRNLDRRDGRLLVAEGLSRLHLLRPADGTRLGRFFLPADMAQPGRLRVLANDRLLHQDPTGQRLTVLDPHGGIVAEIRRPAPIRWAVPLGPDSGRFLLCDATGRVSIEPDGVACALDPAPTPPPRVTGAGIWIDGRLLRWRPGGTGGTP